MRLCRNDADDVGLNDDALLPCAPKNSIVQSLRPQALYRLRNSWFLSNVGLS